MLALGLPLSAAAQTEGETFSEGGLEYNVIAADTVEVTGGTAVDGTLSVPATVEHGGQKYIVAAIGEKAFKGADIVVLDLTAATSLECIGASAFAENKQLTTVKFPAFEESQLKEIGPLAFQHDTALSSINLEDTHIEVLEALFTKNADDERYFDSLTELRLPETLKEIKSYALQFLGISTITIPEGVTAFGEGVLEGNIYLEEFYWKGAQVTGIARNTFLGDDALTTVYLLTVEPLAFDGLTDMHFFMCHKEMLTVWVTQRSYDMLVAAGYTNENSIYSTLAVDTEWVAGINGVKAEQATESDASVTSASGVIYTLQGTRVTAPQKGGIYIRNGRKFVQK